MKHLLNCTLFCILTVFSFAVMSSNVQAADFVPLVGIPGINTQSSELSLAGYVDALYTAAISIAAFMAVVKIIFAGVKYMISDLVNTKEEAKKDIRGALIGLLIVLGAVLILNTINPQLKGLTAIDGLGGITMELEGMDVSIAPGTTTGEDCSTADDFTKYSEGCSTGVLVIPSGTPGCMKLICPLTPGQIAEDNCPEGKTCGTDKCDTPNLRILQSCSNQCTERNGVYYDASTGLCVFINANETPVANPITVNDSIDYYKKQNEDEEAGGYPLIELIIIGESSIDGFVRVMYEDGTEGELTCSYIVPSVCD